MTRAISDTREILIRIGSSFLRGAIILRLLWKASMAASLENRRRSRAALRRTPLTTPRIQRFLKRLALADEVELSFGMSVSTHPRRRPKKPRC